MSIAPAALSSTSGGGNSTITTFLGSTTAGPVNILQVGSANITLGQKAMASSFPVVIASDQSGIAVTGTFWQATQPVSGTVTANAGTGTFNIQANASVNVAQVGGASFALGQQLAAASLPVVLTAAQLTTLTPPTTVTANQGTPTNWLMNVAQINGVTPLMGNGVTGTGSLRVTIASDNTAFAVNATLSAETTKVIGTVNQGTSPWIVAGGGTAGTAATGVVTVQGIAGMTKLLVTPDSVALPANQSVNVAQIAGTNTVTGGVAGLIAVGGNVANAGTATANPVPVGGVFTTTPTTLTTGQTATLQFTAAQNAKHDITTIAGTAPTTVGKLDVKGADGDVFVRQSTATNLNAAVVGTGTAGSPAGNILTVQGVASMTKLLVTPDSVALPANQSVNVAQIAGNTTSTAASGTQLVGVADGAGNKITTNSTTFTAKFAFDTNLLGTLGTAFSTAGKVDVKAADGDVFVRSNAASTFPTQATLQTQTDTVMVGGVNIKEINAVTPLMGNGVTGTGSQRVTVASDNTGIANWGHGATGSAVPAGATYHGVNPQTALPTAATAGNLTGVTSDKFGRVVVLPQGFRDLVLPMTQLTLTATTTETTLITAVASTFLDLISVVVINTSATATQVDFRDSTAGTVRLSIYVPAGDMRGISFTSPLPQNAVNNNWTAKSLTSVSSIIITGSYITNK